MTITAASLRGMSDELRKLADVAPEHVVEKTIGVGNITQRDMKAGDVIFTSPDKNKIPTLLRYTFKPVSRIIQGTDYGHAAIYVGSGNAVDARMGAKVKEVPISKLTKSHRMIVLRPDVPDEEKKDAVDFAKSRVGKKYSLLNLLRSATPWRGDREKDYPVPSDKAKMICSALVANAYHRRKFSDKSRDITRPSEILKSHILKPVGYINKIDPEPTSE